ncbi:rhomboid family intramembrane serine protease [Pengzhenrongella frigida]|uniref:Rhomboid family intramembrane serine protease n=1 Tax=Pengzhenrongella frigida TaxID=1259133 RepID=A0A4Q5N191_9MICO|nr:rhomboid family intramembrane serine protease [Cellulomonas sp. HLT2-17]RYV51830.1 rhomboid family intramembrane serine protease [Cellulomonas sp. HLT2-17]
MSTEFTAGPAASEQPPVCPRHPDRVSYVRCQRCGRPVCPECQRPAAVGVHCVDCVRTAARAMPATRTALGGRVRDGRPVVTLTIIGLCVASFIAQQVIPGWTTRWIFSPAAGQIEPIRFISAAFLHSSSIFHIAFNMYALWLVGPYLESTLGRWRFAALYLLSAVGGSVGVLLFASPVITPTDVSWISGVVGASGAVFGLFGAILVVLRRLGRDARQILVFIAINGVIGFVVPNIAWQAHLGGLVTGVVLGAAYAYAPRKYRQVAAVSATVGVAVLLVVLALAKYASV